MTVARTVQPEEYILIAERGGVRPRLIELVGALALQRVGEVPREADVAIAIVVSGQVVVERRSQACRGVGRFVCGPVVGILAVVRDAVERAVLQIASCHEEDRRNHGDGLAESELEIGQGVRPHDSGADVDVGQVHEPKHARRATRVHSRPWSFGEHGRADAERCDDRGARNAETHRASLPQFWRPRVRMVGLSPGRGRGVQ